MNAKREELLEKMSQMQRQLDGICKMEPHDPTKPALNYTREEIDEMLRLYKELEQLTKDLRELL